MYHNNPNPGPVYGQPMQQPLFNIQQNAQEQEAPPAFYQGLPAPWNIVPCIPAGNNEDLLKNISKGRLIVFDGKRRSFDPWREKFITCIHIKRTSPAAKALALQASLDPKRPNV